jgi:hypothetical protein
MIGGDAHLWMTDDKYQMTDFEFQMEWKDGEMEGWKKAAVLTFNQPGYIMSHYSIMPLSLPLCIRIWRWTEERF